MDEHIIEALGKTRVVIKNGKVVEIGEPKVCYCPLFEKYRGIKKLTSEEIAKNIQFRIDDFGMCTSQRTLKMKDFLSFGVSETLGTLLDDGLIDCVVAVCEGCGTVIITDPEVIQGVGGRVSGLLSTTPIEEVIEALGRENILDPEQCAINQVQGVLKALDLGYKRIAVTIVTAEDALKLRELDKKLEDAEIYIFAVHTTAASHKEAEMIFDNSDIVTGCASKFIRKTGNERKVFSVGASIPVYGVTEAGEKFIKRRIEKIGGLKVKKDAKIPKPLI